LREPLVHFLVVAVALFVVYRVMNPQSEGAEPSRQITLTADDFDQLRIVWLAQGRPAPTPEQMRNLVEAKVREEILYREALALGLDKDDTIVKRRLAQKMEFLAEDLSGIEEPSTDQLKTWYETNAQRFALPPRVSFRHLYFSFDRRGERTEEAAKTALAALPGKPRDARDGAPLADPFMFQDTYGDRTFTQMATLFGLKFAQALFALKPGSWQGPIESGYGWHLIWIDSLTPSRIPPFEEVQSAVKSEWVADQREQAKRKMFDAMRTRYQVVVPEFPADPASDKPSPPPEPDAATAGN
jgi:peptidyl-prolyl cis-trans isomerase C